MREIFRSNKTFLSENILLTANLEQTYGGSVATGQYSTRSITTQVYTVADWRGLISDKLSPGPG